MPAITTQDASRQRSSPGRPAFPSRRRKAATARRQDAAKPDARSRRHSGGVGHTNMDTNTNTDTNKHTDTDTDMDMASRTYGSRGPLVVLLHGGPGAPGYLAPLARMLASTCRVLEPFQRGATDEPLTVARHVADLHAVLAPEAPAVVLGHSWGAMLALAHAAAHPETPRALVLVGCGTFDEKSRAAFRRAHDDRLDANTRRKLEHATLAEAGRLLLPVYSHDLVTSDLELAGCDARAHDETWRDMIRLQEEGVYPAAFAAVTCPVLMLHGEKDPHPGASTREVLRQHIPHLEYRAWDCCGHYPWLERAVACEFVDVVREYAESV